MSVTDHENPKSDSCRSGRARLVLTYRDVLSFYILVKLKRNWHHAAFKKIRNNPALRQALNPIHCIHSAKSLPDIDEIKQYEIRIPTASQGRTSIRISEDTIDKSRNQKGKVSE